MYKIQFFISKNGKSQVLNYINKLKTKTDKSSRIKLSKIQDCINYLKANGSQVKEPYAKHLYRDIWELRPLRDRILYAYYDNNCFVLLHLFQKDTQKTPKREIQQALANLDEYKKRGRDHEKRKKSSN